MAWETQRGARVKRARFPWVSIALWLALPLALTLALKGVRLADVGRTLGRLGPGPIAVLAVVNLGVVAAFAGRWWVLLATNGYRLPYGALTLYRLAAFSISYFTPGTQFGGEPLQVHLLERRDGVPLATATASVVLDRVLELLANFAFLALGTTVVLGLGVYPRGAAIPLVLAAVSLLALPLLYIVAARSGRRPGTWILAHAPSILAGRRWMEQLRGFVSTAEDEVRRLTLDRPLGIIAGLAASGVSWAALLAEWWLATAYLGFPLDVARLVAVVTATRLAFLVPVPGALGALEASLLLSLTALGYQPQQAISLALFIRVRDVAFGAAGLYLGAALAAPPR